MATPRIIHISDTHFTDSSRTLEMDYILDYQKSGQRSALLANYLFNNEALINSNIVVITGDLTDSGDVGDYKIAKEFIEKLGRYGFKAYSVPGNHDCSKEGNLMLGQLEFGQTVSRRDNFIKYLTPDYGSYPHVVTLRDNNFLILLDSLLGQMQQTNIFTRDCFAQGMLGNDQLRNLNTVLTSLQPYRKSGKKVFVALHHSPFDDDSKGLLEDRSQFLGIINSRIDCLLYGHTTPSGVFHKSFPSEEKAYNIPVINCENLEHDRCWVGEMSMGGYGKQICVGQNQDGRLEIFYIGTNDKIYHNWQLGTNGKEWSGEFAMGGYAKHICVGQNQDGRMEIFYVGTDNQLYHNWQDKPNSGWVGEFKMGGAGKQICVGQNQDGRLEIFYIGMNDQIYHNAQDMPNSGWMGEMLLGGGAKQICLARNKDGRLELFYVDIKSNKICHSWQVNPNSGWTSGKVLAKDDEARQICIGQNPDGRLEIFYVGTNDKVYHNWQVSANSSNWNGEVYMGSEARQICVGQNQDGRLEIIYIGTNNRLYHDFQSEFGWRGEEMFSKYNDEGKQICVARNQDGRLEAFYIGTNSAVYHNYQAQPNSGTLPITVIDFDRKQREIYWTDSTIPTIIPIV